jgi:energy-coupling factor transporter ATP-binding protein EcfA2
VSRRRARLRSDLASAAAGLEELQPFPDPELERRRRQLRDTLRGYLIPRLDDLPLVVGLLGSTGAGKSTILNSVAGRPVSRSGPLRPTTRNAVVWTSPRYAPDLQWMGKVVGSDHPLADELALVDTPDIDSDLVENRRAALSIAAACDALVVVTTAARYGDAAPWSALAAIPERPLAVVLNRLPSRSSGVRNDLKALLRSHGRADAIVMTIGEQPVDRFADKLRPQSVQRLTALLREWIGDRAGRRAFLGQTAGEAARDLERIVAASLSRNTAAADFESGVRAAYEGQLREVVAAVAALRRQARSSWWPWRRRARADDHAEHDLIVGGLSRAGAEAGSLARRVGIAFPAKERTPPPGLLQAVDTVVGAAFDEDRLGALFAEEAERISGLAPADPTPLVSALAAAVDLLTVVGEDDA